MSLAEGAMGRTRETQPLIELLEPLRRRQTEIALNLPNIHCARSIHFRERGQGAGQDFKMGTHRE
jgi:hypothetical protein